jgi:hypothetical protein
MDLFILLKAGENKLNLFNTSNINNIGALKATNYAGDDVCLTIIAKHATSITKKYGLEITE